MADRLVAAARSAAAEAWIAVQPALAAIVAHPALVVEEDREAVAGAAPAAAVVVEEGGKRS